MVSADELAERRKVYKTRIMKRFVSVLCCAVVAMTLAACAEQEDFTKWVDQRIGTGGHGHVFMGANVPFGLVQVGPTSIPQDWDWCSGYHESDLTVNGFSHTHLSGTGIGDLFDVTVMPVVGEVKYARGHTAHAVTRKSIIVYRHFYP